MLSTHKESIRCLGVLYVSCTIFVCLLILYLQRQPVYIEVVFPQTKSLDYSTLFDLKDFKYVLNGGKCNADTFAIFIVTSYAGDVETRSAVRQAYPNRLLQKHKMKRVFLLALIQESKNFDHVEQEAIVNEQERFNDLVQGNFIEDYKNLTYKHTMGLKWVSEYCNTARYVIKMDHDIVFDLFAIETFLKKLPDRDLLLAGYEMYNMHPQRDPANKWYVSKEEYALDEYPNFLSGWLYITNPNTAELLYKETRSVPYFWIDDLYITGIVAQRLNLKFAGLNKYYTTDPEKLKCCLTQPLVECPFWVGPNGGNSKLIVEFSKHNKKCVKTKCANISVSRCGKEDPFVHIL